MIYFSLPMVLQQYWETLLTCWPLHTIRLFIGEGSYVIDQGIKHDLEVPSGSQSGLKLIHQFTIEEGKLYELLLDFNVEKSIVITGNGRYLCKPTISYANSYFRKYFGSSFTFSNTTDNLDSLWNRYDYNLY
ncbi:MAG: DUF4382 domain-containing protein [Ignavibacteriaceae bacterium]|nr:DUF4382 domain-containing protein [Ignavibacteriaceae bacterium]